jgi:hypothetical protein
MATKPSQAGKDDDPSRVALYSMILNILVAGAKGWLAYRSGSQMAGKERRANRLDGNIRNKPGGGNREK